MFPERLKELRKKSNLTQKDMAEYFGTSQPSYQAWESGKRNPNSESLDKIANFFNVSTDYLLGNTNIKNTNMIDEAKLDKAINDSLGFNGKPATLEEKENMKEVLRIYLENLNK
ncbi:TPA: helix-turn-helix domain-containing protein [Streptococcus agalactiae]|nr:helix-turn-helix domain-containing protein [Streptococcus agalactiae]HEN0375374.1 helix-turn-helix domain-containing protein [Streptococcus agalactiae]HEN0410442.1 helix-turn-helix domain-containing protein [Streptococcus agalactiae]HEN0452141.1 helix-turn-helix domain-containing protein [Streptococcus agalactiae]HEN0816366.1 helix-turn-helix domain-containing protein [Streptococcus agalactiae]